MLDIQTSLYSLPGTLKVNEGKQIYANTTVRQTNLLQKADQEVSWVLLLGCPTKQYCSLTCYKKIYKFIRLQNHTIRAHLPCNHIKTGPLKQGCTSQAIMEDNENDVVASSMAFVKCCAKNGTHCWATDWLTSFNHNLAMQLTNTGYVMICDMPQALTKQAPMRLNLPWAINCHTQSS